ncbi:fibronectin type III domain-containing protein [Glycomyces sp. TRM65418]|uniref:fibronectin type III domain-containing protein n=1 Tax=Glycomyces sp. TRM65418 TaxID=2867006 RepID=UPI001CE57D03|nr:fibronectin type III domain-containing protein [Glycomyces sp. TRM65418]MCC3762979.1 fibronectin type III domain-containing protein [Glycomyces sp. TRM65418]QZD56997.1 fibronectin type III domain-containing protein [Glycomyces sp. TRM65418]
MTTRNVDARRLNVKGLLIAVGLPVVLVGALVATLLGTGAFSRENDGEDGSLWLWTTPAGELARVNGLTAATDVRFELTDAAGNAVQIEQTDSHLLLREIPTGKVSAIDLSTLELTGEAETAPGEGVRLALADEGAFIIDQTQGLVNQVDPSTLAAIGEPLRFPAGLTGGAFDATGKLWVGVPREGTIVKIEPKDTGAKTLATEVVAQPRQEIALTVLGDGVAVLNSTAKKMTTIRSDGRRAETDIELAGPAQTADTSPGTIASVTVTDPPSVVTVNDEESKSFAIAAAPTNLLGASVEFHQRIYVPDGASGIVWVYDLDGNELDQIEIDAGGGPVELYHTGDTLFANAVNTNAAVVVSSDGNARIAEKDRDDILGGNAPPQDETAGDDEGDEEGNEESAPEIGPPGAVTNLRGTVGDGLINLSWDAAPNNGSALTKYVIEGAGQTWEIAPDQRVLEIGDLDNGTPYTFTVTAHNAEGAGDTATSPSITPSAEVPDPVGAVEATANNDGTVTVTWDEADGQGNDVTGYQIEAVASGKQSVVGQTGTTSFTVPEGSLDYGTQYAFQVTTLAGAAAAAPSAPSNTVVPFNVPDAPTDLFAESSTTAAGTINVTWSQPSNNGRDITKYLVRAGTQTAEVTETTASLSGFGNNERVTVTVTAVNEAGESEPAETVSNTMSMPSVQISGHSATADSITLNMTYDDGGGEATCQMLRDGQTPVKEGSCDSLTQGGLKASTEHTYTVRITNPAGSAASSNYTASTTVVRGQIYFGCDEGMDTIYCSSADGIAIYGAANNNGDSIGRTHSGDRHKAYCWTSGEFIQKGGQESDGNNDYHPGKDNSDKWIKIDYAANAYVPFVWINIDGVGKNSTGDLPAC